MFGKKNLILYLAVYVAVMGALALANWDYNVSYAIVNPDSLWANFFNLFGEVPANLLLLAGIAILYGSRNREILWRYILGHVAALPLMSLLSWVIVYMPINYLFENHSSGVGEGVPSGWIIASVLGGAILLFLTFLFIRRTGSAKLKEMRKAGVLFILLVIGEIVLVNVVKVAWGRPRMRILQSMEGFRKWYVIEGPAPDNNYKSFPSGHTANGFTAIAFSLLLGYVTSVDRRIVWAFGLVWGALVALSRVVLGAHFLSDVITGGYITIFLFLFLNALFFRSKKSA